MEERGPRSARRKLGCALRTVN